MRRRKRKHDTDSFLEAHRETSIKDKGLLCRNCGKWRRWNELHVKYEKQGSVVVMMWICICGTVLREDEK